MKVALTIEKMSFRRGGAERSTLEMAGALCRHGIDVTIIAGRFLDTDALGSVEDLPFSLREIRPQGPLRQLKWMDLQKRLAAIHRSREFDIIHSVMPSPHTDIYQPRTGSMLHAARRHAATYECPAMASWKRFTSGFNLMRRSRIACERQLCHKTDGPVVAALSRYVSEQFQHDYGLSPERICLIRNGVDVSVLRSDQARAGAAKLRERFDPEDRLSLFLYVADNPRRKGLKWLIRAAAKANEAQARHLRKFRIFVIGGFSYSTYWRQTQRLGLEETVIFVGSTGEMPVMYNMCDGIILPTYDDACSRVVMEALAADKPAITTRFNGAADFITEGRHGFVLHESNDRVGLAGAIVQLRDREKQAAMSEAIAADRIHEQVSMQRHTRELVQLYERLAENRRRL